jgi:plasmid stabilization system protein ParE
MGCPVILTPQAQEDLRKIVCYIARDSPERGRKFGNTLIDKALSIAAFPEMGHVVPEVGDPMVREIIHGSYRIIYELAHEPETVFVLRFWHGARGTPELIDA